MIKTIDGKGKKKLLVKLGFILFIFLSILAVSLVEYDKQRQKGSVLGTEEAPMKKSSAPVQDSVSQIQKTTGDALGVTTKKATNTIEEAIGSGAKTLVDTATRSVETAKEYLLDNTAGVIIKQLDRLPQEEKERVKEYICK